MTIADSDGDGSIDIGKFLQLMFSSAGQLISNLKHNFATEADVRDAFASRDSNKDGQISFAELYISKNDVKTPIVLKEF